MTPIEKNVIVVDEFGNEYGATYPKRARGLVKCGRARFIDENRICLACPPQNENKTEDIKMSENKTKKAAEAVETTEIAEATETVETVENTTTKYTLDYVLEQIEKLHADKEYFGTVVTEFKNILACGEDDVGTAECAKALGEAVRCRETTNQQLISLYEKIYDDLKPKAPEPMDPVLKTLTDILKIDTPIIRADYRERIMQQVVEYAKEIKTNKVQSDLDNQNDKNEKINLLLAHLSECQNDSAACYMGDELRRLMED